MIAILSVFRDSNYLECVLWCAIGVGFLARALVRSGSRPTIVVTGITFLLFGASDYVEAHTGAWWQPVGLLIWKGLCLAVFLAVLIRHYMSLRLKRGDRA